MNSNLNLILLPSKDIKNNIELGLWTKKYLILFSRDLLSEAPSMGKKDNIFNSIQTHKRTIEFLE